MRSRLMPLALAVALGLALWQVAAGFSTLVASLVGGRFEPYDGWATWNPGGHTLTFDQLFSGLIEVAIVGAIALLVVRRRPE